MPCFQQAFEAVDELKEAAILVIGAISDEDGCLAQFTEHLAQLIPFLVQQLQSSSSLVKSSAIYALSKFSKWIIEQGNFQQFVQFIVQSMQDADSNVQEAACTCLAVTLQTCNEMGNIDLS